jgi:hypothetical protein
MPKSIVRHPFQEYFRKTAVILSKQGFWRFVTSLETSAYPIKSGFWQVLHFILELALFQQALSGDQGREE